METRNRVCTRRLRNLREEGRLGASDPKSWRSYAGPELNT